ncbi:MAG TPA: pseudouridine synthase [Bacteroidia bacterium]|jgi:23S rRNA pseudouridine2605 synthase|nr:pseudouridine synthase [Bacteroidia bacterium]
MAYSRGKKGPGRSFSGKKPFGKRSGGKSDGNSGERKPFGDKKPFGRKDDGDRPKKRFNDDRGGERKPFGEKKPFARRDDGDRPKRRFNDERGGERKPFGEKKPFARRDDGDRPKRRFNDERGGERKPFGEKKSFHRRDDGDRRPFDKSPERGPKRRFNDERGGERKPFGEKKSFPRRDDGDRPKRRFNDERGGERKPFGERKSFGDKKPFGERKPFGQKDDFNAEGGERRAFKDKPYGNRPGRRREELDRKREELGADWKTFDDKEEANEFVEKNSERKGSGKKELKPAVFSEEGTIRLNRYIANTGLCSRREADDLIEAGVVKVNGKIVTELGTKVSPGDTIHYGDQLLRRESLKYVLLNKPKDYITTTDDPQERKTVLHLVEGAGTERIYPVGRLDRQTVGLLLLTNDGDLAERLTHPRYGIRKIYHVSLDKNLRQDDFAKLEAGMELEDGFIKADEASYVGDGTDKKEVGVVMHSGRNRIVRRMFEHLGYDVIKLDRVSYAGLTKKNLPRGKWRFLTKEEVNFLKMQVGANKRKF